MTSMARIDLEEHLLTARVPELGNPSHLIEAPVLVRVDPLTGHTARVVRGDKLSPSVRPDLTELTAPPRFCPFCEGTLEQATGLLDPAITAEGRIRRGVSAVVPNVVAYADYCVVGLYDTTRHFVDLDEFTPTLVGDLLAGLTAYTRGVHALGPRWHSLSANYLPPAGSSLVHPHAQSCHDPIGTTTQRQLVAAAAAWPGEASFAADLLETEGGGPRWLGLRGRVAAVTPWAPVGFHQVDALLPGVRDLTELTDEDCHDLGAVIAGVLHAYHGMNLASFNWALFGGGPTPSDRYAVHLRMVSRSNPTPMYRSDVTYFERLHAEALLDLTPEQVAESVRPHLAAVGVR